ncbi:MAG: hypothetical protein N2204_07295 [Anaerolineae bacterium]|nr:hypothetical protein [Anaerolineae bacterium]
MSAGGRFLAALLLGLLLAVIGGLIYALWLMGAEMVRLLAVLLLVGGLLIGLVWAAQFPIRAWRSNVQPERHIYHEKVREIHHAPDLRATPGTPALPPRPAEPVYPELMRAAFLAGLLDGRSTVTQTWEEADDGRGDDERALAREEAGSWKPEAGG